MSLHTLYFLFYLHATLSGALTLYNSQWLPLPTTSNSSAASSSTLYTSTSLLNPLMATFTLSMLKSSESTLISQDDFNVCYKNGTHKTRRNKKKGSIPRRD